MCLKTSLKVLVFCFCFTGLVQGSCNSFGHSCWGAHGKRSNVQTRQTDNEWKFLRAVPENNEPPKSDVSSQMFAENDMPLYENIRTPELKTLDIPGLASDENQNNMNPRYPKKKYRITKYKTRMDAGSNEAFGAESKNLNLAIRDEFKMPDYRLLKMLRRELVN